MRGSRGEVKRDLFLTPSPKGKGSGFNLIVGVDPCINPGGYADPPLHLGFRERSKVRKDLKLFHKIPDPLP